MGGRINFKLGKKFHWVARNTWHTFEVSRTTRLEQKYGGLSTFVKIRKIQGTKLIKQ